MTRSPSQSGLTLVEILVVVFLISIFVRLFLPPLGGILPYGIRDASRELSAELRYASQRAVSTGEIHRWVVDLDEQLFHLERIEITPLHFERGLPTHAGLLDTSAPRPAEEIVPVMTKLGEWRALDQEAVWIDKVWIGEEEFDDGTIGILFAADGAADPAELLLLDEGGHAMALRVQPFTSEISATDVTP